MNDEVADLLSKSDDQLFTRLGRVVDKSVSGDDDAAEAGRSYFEARLSAFATAVCGDERITALRRQHADAATLGAAIVDVLTALLGVPGVATVAVLLLRYGLDKLCGS